MLKKIVTIIVICTLSLVVTITGFAQIKHDSTKIWNGHTYSVYVGNVELHEAYNYCAKNGGHLVSITSAAENQLVYGMITTGDYYLIGGSDAGSEGHWYWLTGERWTYSNWNRGEPNNGNGGKPQNYSAMYSNGTWDDAWTPDKNIDGFICEWDTADYKPECGKSIPNNANDLQRKIDEYLDTLKGEMEKETQKEDTIDALAKALMESDEQSNHKVLSIPMDMKDEKAVLAAYKAYAEILKDIYDKKIELGEIDIKDSITKISTELVNDVFSLFNFTNEHFVIDGYSVTVRRTGVASAGVGAVTVKKGRKTYIIPLVSKSKDVLDVYADFVEELRDISYDVSKQAITSVLTELADVTGFSDWEKSEIKDALKDAAKHLDKNGYGDFYKTAEKCREIYELINDVISIPKNESFDKSIKDTEKLIKKLENLDFSDEAVTNKAVKHALDEIMKYKKELIESLQDYIYKVETNECPKEEKGFFDSIKEFFGLEIQCPVDVEIFDKYGYTVGYIKDGVAHGADNIFVEKNGDTKTVLIPANKDYRIKMTAVDDGAMNYVIKKYVEGKQVGRLNYYDIELEEGAEYTQYITGDRFSEDGEMLPVVSDDAEIFADEYLEYGKSEGDVIVVAKSGKGGKVLNNNGELYFKGDPVELTAYSLEDGYKFDGWYIKDEVVSTDTTYRFTALEDVVVECRFRYIGAVTSFDSPVSDWAKDEVEEAYECGLIPEVLIGENLTKSITRAEFAAVAVKLYETWSGTIAKYDMEVSFTDIEGNANQREIIKAYGLGITAGISETSFAPDSLITREQLATMLCRTYKKKEWKDWTLANDNMYTLNYSGVMKFADDSDISDYAKPSVYFMVKYGVINGVGNNMFAPKNTTSADEAIGYATATREQAVLMALRSYQNLN